MTLHKHPSGFRPDINGLRTWAVLAVVLYHFRVGGFGGGFVGVDVFFVISGYLMTGIVVRGLERGDFSIIGFYLARARRIVPALLALCATLLALGWFFLLPPDYKVLGTHSVTAVTFWSNLRFWDESGYFDSSSHEKWLLHTWSLSVEWQFYLLLPVLLLAVWRLKPGRQAQAVCIGIALAASLFASVWITPRDATQAFYGLHTRAWEMLAGGIVFLIAPQAVSASVGWVLEAIGLSMIVAAIGVFDGQTTWPGYRAMLPVTGAVLVLIARRRASAFTGTAVAQWVGDRSYSIYLWHWPMVVLLVYINELANPIYVMGGVLMTLVLAELSYRFVETPARGWLKHPETISNLIRLGVSVGLVTVAGVAAWKLNGVAGRFAPASELAAAEALNVNPRDCVTPEGTAVQPCHYGGPVTKLILLGDSHANAVATAVEAAVPSKEAGFEQWSYAACPMILGVTPTPGTYTAKRKNYHCAEYVAEAIERLKTLDPTVPVLVVTRASLALHGLNEETRPQPPEFFIKTPVRKATPESIQDLQQAYVKTICTIAAKRKVYLMRPIPEMAVDIPKLISRKLALGLDAHLVLPLAAYKHRNQDAWAMQDAAEKNCGAVVVDPTPMLCPDNFCQSSSENRPLYADDDHLSEFGNKAIVSSLRKIY
jgi:peptidoglycan/LPS O-acetylase OafA/YrhL